MDSSSGKSVRSRFAICSGLHDLAHRRSARRPVTPPDPPNGWARHGGAIRPGDRPGEPILHVLAQRSAALAAILEILGRLARRSACHCAVVAR